MLDLRKVEILLMLKVYFSPRILEMKTCSVVLFQALNPAFSLMITFVSSGFKSVQMIFCITLLMAFISMQVAKKFYSMEHH